MKQFLTILMVLWCGVVMAQTEPGFSYTSFPSIGPRTVATATFAVPLAGPVRLPTLPEGTKRFVLRASLADIICSSLANIATGATTIGVRIAMGESRSFDTATTTPSWYFLASGTVAASATIDVAE
jgi:hypothetical protein